MCARCDSAPKRLLTASAVSSASRDRGEKSIGARTFLLLLLRNLDGLRRKRQEIRECRSIAGRVAVFMSQSWLRGRRPLLFHCQMLGVSCRQEMDSESQAPPRCFVFPLELTP